MLEISEDLKNKLIEINEEIRQKYYNLDIKPHAVMEKIKMSKSLLIRHMRKLKDEEMKAVTRNKGIVGVDGSINTVGSSYPHYISIMQSLAKCTNRRFKDIVLADIHTPLFTDNRNLFIDEQNSLRDKDEKAKAAKMAALELEAAIKALETTEASVIMMDGSLIRYKINCGEKWDSFVNDALKRQVFIIGVIEEIKTKDLCSILDLCANEAGEVFDREILFGALEVGEMIIMKDSKEGRGLKKCFMRTSNDPHVIGMDILEGQHDRISELADLVYTLTPENGRGIPLWLDVVDSEVKITNKLVDSLVDSHIDEDIRLRLFTAKRDNRSL